MQVFAFAFVKFQLDLNLMAVAKTQASVGKLLIKIKPFGRHDGLVTQNPYLFDSMQRQKASIRVIEYPFN